MIGPCILRGRHVNLSLKAGLRNFRVMPWFSCPQRGGWWWDLESLREWLWSMLRSSQNVSVRSTSQSWMPFYQQILMGTPTRYEVLDMFYAEYRQNRCPQESCHLYLLSLSQSSSDFSVYCALVGSVSKNQNIVSGFCHWLVWLCA